MNRILTLLMSFVLITVTAVHGQQFTRCGYDHYVNALNQDHDILYERIDQIIKRSKSSFRDDEILTIPVVVHIVHNDSAQIKSDREVNEIIEVLNENFRNLNENKVDLRSEFLEVSGDPRIEFELDRIIRVETDTKFEINIFAGTLPDNVKLTEQGGSDAVDPDRFMNIWVCHIEGGSLLGYAYPPAGLSNWPQGSNAPDQRFDGIVIHEGAFHKNREYQVISGNDTIVIDLKGRTVVHEIGHYLGLRHIWGDGISTLFGIPNCQEDDGVEDTPNQGLQSSFKCDPTQNTCTDSENDLFDMYENYMDYSQEKCQSTFTNGQIAIMRSVLRNERASLVGITSTDDENEIYSLYPNPTYDVLYFSRALNNYQCDIYNLHGTRVKTYHITDNQIDIQDLPQGLYTLRVFNDDNLLVKKIIKM